jgi:hypothetical protein
MTITLVIRLHVCTCLFMASAPVEGAKGGGGLKNLSVNRQIVFQSAKRELDIETNQNSNRIIKIVELYIPL